MKLMIKKFHARNSSNSPSIIVDCRVALSKIREKKKKTTEKAIATKTIPSVYRVYRVYNKLLTSSLMIVALPRDRRAPVILRPRSANTIIRLFFMNFSLNQRKFEKFPGHGILSPLLTDCTCFLYPHRRPTRNDDEQRRWISGCLSSRRFVVCSHLIHEVKLITQQV